MKKAIFLVIGLLFCRILGAICSPVSELERASDQLITALQQNRATIKTQPQVVYRIVNQIILPLVDIEGMSSRALGRSVWFQASREQKYAFSRQLITLLIRTYANALAQYTDEELEFLPLRPGLSYQAPVTVYSIIYRDRSAGRPIHVSYHLTFKYRRWMLYDFSVEGISIIENFRSQFSEVLQQRGINGLINELAQYNAQSY